MNYTELQALVLSETHRENYAPYIVEFIERAEALIKTKLDAYGLEYTFTDADRGGDVESPVYTLPARVTLVRYLRTVDYPLDQVDENLLATRKRSNNMEVFCVRANTLAVAGTPPADTELTLDYFGLPAPLSLTPTNALLTDYPQLYIEAASMYVYRRAQDYESAQGCSTAFGAIVWDINRKISKMLGGARGSNVYNVGFRSSY